MDKNKLKKGGKPQIGKKTPGIVMPIDAMDRLKQIAKRRGMPYSSMIRMIIMDWLNAYRN